MSDKVQVFDTTLRDGEQAAGSRLDVREKLEIAKQLEVLNVDIIEAGFPVSSPKDFEAVALIAKEVRNPIICGLSRVVANDIEVCGKALSQAQRSRIHTGIGISDIHITGKFADDKYGSTLARKKVRIIEMSVQAVQYARGFTDDVEFYAEDSGRADREYLIEIITAVIDAGATVVNIPDTTGYTMPTQFGGLIKELTARVPNISQATISVHCHNDLGLASANTLAGVEHGARQIEAKINGIGERAGNAALEEVVMALHTRKDYYDVHTNVNTQEFYRTSRMVAEKLNMTIPKNKAIIGDNAFSHSSGIHVDGVLKERKTYEIIDPRDVGFSSSQIILTARSGRSGVNHRLKELGCPITRERLDEIYPKFLEVADNNQDVSDAELMAILSH